MEEIETNEELNITSPPNEEKLDNVDDSKAIIEYKEIDEPCVALTIIGENRLTDTEVFIKKGLKYSIKAFFSAIVLTIMHMFI